jgi:hypothetical protein
VLLLSRARQQAVGRLVVMLVLLLLHDGLRRCRRIVMRVTRIERRMLVRVHMLVFMGMHEVAVPMLMRMPVHVLVDVRFG